MSQCEELASRQVVDRDMSDLPATTCRKLRGVDATRTSFARASFANVWLEESTFASCDFGRSDLRGLSDHGNRFDRCTFRHTQFGHAALGYQGSRYVDCTFERARFGGTVFARAVFVRCDFVDCGIAGIDFGASRFTDCRFVGELNEVFFRGRFASPQMTDRFGAPEGRPVLKVDFTGATLHDVTFSGGLDLNDVQLPARPGYFLFDDWPGRLQMVETALAASDREAIDTFVNAFASRDSQMHQIISRDDLDAWFGSPVAERLLSALGPPTKSSGPAASGFA
jgi:uncharacterized protein YjbI with pentapeptide repeats